MSYVTAEQLRDYLGVSDNVDVTSALTDAVADASAWVDAHCYRSFAVPANGATPTQRTFQTISTSSCWVDDFSTTSGLVVTTSADRLTWRTIDAGNIAAAPPNALVASPPRAYTAVETLGVESLDEWVRVTALWGWTLVPEPVERATKLVAHWLLKRRDSPYGIEGFDGVALRVSGKGDPDVLRLLSDLRRYDRVVGVA